MAGRITVYEVGPRDGLQNEAATLATGEKLALVRALVDAGLSRIEATSFVSPRWIPQLADAAELTAALPPTPGVTYVVLVPNARGLDRLDEALRRAGDGRAQVEAAVFLSASETHNRKNVNKTVEETFREFEALVPEARRRGLRVRGYVSTAWGCPYEGRVEPERAAAVAERLLAIGCAQVSLGDTIGVGTPGQTRRIVSLVLRSASPEHIALHLHDTRGTALANVLAGLEEGITTFDASVGGLGGCPYAPGASGNLATEDLVYMLHGMGYETGVDFDKLIQAGALAQRLVGRRLPGKTLQAELARAEQDRSLRCVILTGAGDKAFCAGADLKERARMRDEEVHAFHDGLRAALRGIEQAPQVFVAALNGATLGGGLELALACDLRIAADSAQMGLPEVSLGIIPGGGGTQRLARLVGVARAKDLVLTARRVGAAEALAMGLVARIAPPHLLRDEAFALAGEVARNAPISLRQAKRAIDGGFHLSLDDALALENRMYQDCLGTKDRVEALRAFAEKRPPLFTGE